MESTARLGAAVSYAIGFIVLLLVWWFVVGAAAVAKTPLLWAGLIFGVVFMFGNLTLSQYESFTPGSGTIEREDARAVMTQSFYVVAALLAFAQLLTTIHGANGTPPLRWFVGVMFFAVAMILPPLWFSPEADAAEVIAKHARTACMVIGISLLVGILAFTYTHVPDTLVGRIAV